MKCSLGISNFLEEISSLSHSVVFLYFFALITEEGFLLSPCYSLEHWIHMGMSFFFSFGFPLFSQLFVRPPQTAFLHFFFLGMVLITASCTVSQYHELLIAKFKLKLKKVGKTTRPFSYDLNKIPYDLQWKWEIDLRD